MIDGAVIGPRILGEHTPPIAGCVTGKVWSGIGIVLLKMSEHRPRSNNLRKWEQRSRHELTPDLLYRAHADSINASGTSPVS